MNRVATPPRALGALLLVGPSLIWCAEYIGSGEVIIATRTGAILGTGVLWAIVFGVFLKLLNIDARVGVVAASSARETV